MLPEGFFIQHPWKHQKEAVERVARENHEDFALFFEQGTGKTAIAINIFRLKCAQAQKLLDCLIFCPPIVIPQWEQELKKNSKPVMHDKIVQLTGSEKQRVKEIQRYKAIPRIFITNYEALLMEDLYKEFMNRNFKFLIFDESHKLKEPKAKRSKAAERLADQTTNKLILTGTPILNSMMDIFQQYRVLDGGKTFGSNFFAFRAKYFYDANAGMPQDRYFPDWKPRPDVEDEISRLIYQKAMRVEKHDCLDLPPLVKRNIAVSLSKEQRDLYDELEAEMIGEIQGEVITTQMALVKALRLQQIVSGFVRIDTQQDQGKVYEDEARDRVFAENPRLEVLEEVLVDIVNGQKCIVWAVFKQNYAVIRSLCEKLKLPYVELTGEHSTKENFEAVHKFQVDPNIKIIIANPKAGGVGVNLVEAPYAVWFSRDFSLESYLQGEARNYRGGSEMHQKVTRIDLVSPGTIDEEIVKALQAKKKVSDLVLDGSGRLRLGAC